MSEDKNTLEDNILEGYEYDGIKEYDNPCPPWLMYIFYFTAALATFFVGYHLGSSSKNEMLELYIEQLQNVQIQTTEQEPLVSESELIALLEDPAALASGAEVFSDKCALCHGNTGEGMIGPNLIDNYWLYGKGKISDIAVSIRSGIPDNGMAAWQDRIPEVKILLTAASISTLKPSQVDCATVPAVLQVMA
ncbi:MAG: c-type cytochrome [Candidatus Brocadiaceae bacterium]|nr:c-type cytochrome [Candidatus Brocadiaceae bacterium]